MATTCELTAVFDESIQSLYDQFAENMTIAERWGTRWDVVREVRYELADGAVVWEVWGFTSAYARVDGMGGHVSFVMTFTTDGTETALTAAVSSPYEGRGEHSAHYRRSHQVALRLMEFCVAPYEAIHPRVGRLKRLTDNLRSSTAPHGGTV